MNRKYQLSHVWFQSLQRKYLRNIVQYICAFNNKQIVPSIRQKLTKKATVEMVTISRMVSNKG